MIKRVTKDFETRSRCDLKACGAYKYSLDPSTQPTCLAFKIRGEPTVYFLPFEVINRPWKDQDPKLKNLWQRLIDERYEFSAHNSFFERCIYDNILVKRYGWPEIDPRLRRCTAAKAAACALPRKLEHVGEALKLAIQKDKRGYQAMMATCKPTRTWKAWTQIQTDIKAGKRIGEKKRKKALEPEPPIFLEPGAAPEVWKTLYRYCKIDVRTEELLDETLPDLSKEEQEVWHFNQMLNWRGLRVDLPTIRKIVGIMEIEHRKKVKELDFLTMGLVTKANAIKSILEFLELDDVKLPNLQAKTIDDILKGFTLNKDMRDLLEIRRALSKASTKKYQAFLNRANEDERLRDLSLYHGASTGRDAGTGINPYNFPRGLLKVDKDRPYAAVENIVECDHELLKLLYGESLGILFSAVLRNMIIPSPGHELFVGDFSAIEVAVLWWLADNKPGLEVLRAGRDPYRYMAAANTGKSYEDIGEEGEERQLGKAQVLGCGFGMGSSKFQKTAWDMHRLKLSEEQSILAVQNYRRANESVPLLWKAYEAAALSAVEKPGEIFDAGKCRFLVKDQFLWARLPSGRKLAYRDPQISWRETDYGPRKTLEFWAVNSKTKKWALERTWGGTLTENMVQATARDLMMPALLRLEKARYKVLLSVYDEGVCERETGKGDIDEFIGLLCKTPEWAEGLPVRAKGWQGPRYRK